MRLSGGLRGYLTRLYGVTIVNFLEIHMRLSVAKCALLKCYGPQPEPAIPAGPLEQVGAPEQKQKGPLWRLWDAWDPYMVDPIGQMHLS